MPNNKIGFTPIVNKNNFKCLWSLDSGWGYVSIKGNKATVKILEGFLELKELELPFIKKLKNIKIDNKNVDATPLDNTIFFDKIKIISWLNFSQGAAAK